MTPRYFEWMEGVVNAAQKMEAKLERLGAYNIMITGQRSVKKWLGFRQDKVIYEGYRISQLSALAHSLYHDVHGSWTDIDSNMTLSNNNYRAGHIDLNGFVYYEAATSFQQAMAYFIASAGGKNLGEGFDLKAVTAQLTTVITDKASTRTSWSEALRELHNKHNLFPYRDVGTAEIRLAELAEKLVPGAVQYDWSGIAYC